MSDALTGEVARPVEVAREPDRPNERTIELLEEMLEEAKNGSIQCVAIAALTSDGANVTVFNFPDRHQRVFSMLGAILYLEHRILSEKVET